MSCYTTDTRGATTSSRSTRRDRPRLPALCGTSLQVSRQRARYLFPAAAWRAMMITYFDLARIDQDNRICHVSSRLRMSMSPDNATRLLGILGAVQNCTFLHPREMQSFLQRAISE